MEPAPRRQLSETSVSEAQEQQKVAGFCESRDEGEVRPRETLAWGEGQRLESTGGTGMHVRGRRKHEAPGEV